jgi:hypothetical protein
MLCACPPAVKRQIDGKWTGRDSTHDAARLRHHAVRRAREEPISERRRLEPGERLDEPRGIHAPPHARAGRTPTRSRPRHPAVPTPRAQDLRGRDLDRHEGRVSADRIPSAPLRPALVPMSRLSFQKLHVPFAQPVPSAECHLAEAAALVRFNLRPPVFPRAGRGPATPRIVASVLGQVSSTLCAPAASISSARLAWA